MISVTDEQTLAALRGEIAGLREGLRNIHDISRQALFERTHRSAAKASLDALSTINKMTANYK